MNKKIISLFVLIGLFSLTNLTLAQVQINNPLCRGGGVCINDFGTLLLRIAWYVGILIGSIGTIMIILSGIFFLTSAGSPERITKAKATLTYAIIGIAIGISSSAIVGIILEIIGGK